MNRSTAAFPESGTFRAGWKAARPLAAGVLLFLLLSLFPMEGAYRIPSGAVVQGWFCRGVRLAFPLVFAGLAVFSAWIWRRTGERLAGAEPGTGSAAAALQALRPLAWLPALAAFRHAAGWIGVPVAAMALPFGIPLLLALVAERFSRPAFEGAAAPGVRPLRRFAPFAVAFAALLVLAVWPARGRFRGGGDVGHYETQTWNLVENGTLDLTERVEGWMDEARVAPADRPEYVLHSHMRRNGAGRIFSVHAYGWPLLAWPFAKAAGDAGETLLCILIGAMALAGVFAACRRCGASEAASRWATALLGLSWFWVYTSLSRLPEMLGCGLCVWAFWAVVAQRDPAARLRATAVSAACCGYLPFAHMRFVAIAAVLALAFLAAGAVPARDGTDRRRGVRLLLHAAAVALAWTVLWRVHRAMFAGVASFNMGEIFFARPVAMLGIFADRRGAGGIFPLIWLLFLAPVPFLFRGEGRIRGAAALALALEATTLVACCANSGTLEGACVSARYFLQAIPPLVPFGALWLDRAGRPGRRWWFFLSWMPVLYLFAISPRCSGGGLVFSPGGLWEFDAFRSFWQPLREMFRPLPAGRAALCLVLPASVAAASFAVSGRRPSRGALAAFWLLLAAGAAAGLAATRFLPGGGGEPPGWAFGNAHFWHEFRRIGGPAPASFFEAFGSGTDGKEPAVFATLAGRDVPVSRADGKRIDADAVAPNDWEGRDLRWALVRTFRPRIARRGAVAIRIGGTADGGPALLSAAAAGETFFRDGVPVGPGPFDAVLLVPMSGARTTVFAALPVGTDALRLKRIDVMPWAAGLDRGAGPFPEGTVVADGLRRRRGAGAPAAAPAEPL